MENEQMIESVLALGREVFNREIGVDDDFFSLGGDSLNATELTVRLEALLGREIDAQQLWEAETFLGFARQVVAQTHA